MKLNNLTASTDLIFKFIKLLLNKETGSNLVFKKFQNYYELKNIRLEKLKNIGFDPEKPNNFVYKYTGNFEEDSLIYLDIDFNFEFNNNIYKFNLNENLLTKSINTTLFLFNEEYAEDNTDNFIFSYFSDRKIPFISDKFIHMVNDLNILKEELKYTENLLNENQFIVLNISNELLINNFLTIESFLKIKNATAKLPYSYNDSDNKAFILENEHLKTIFFEDQTMIFVHILEKNTNELTIFDATHLKAYNVSAHLKNVNYLYFINNYYKKSSEFILFNTEKGLNIKSPLSFFFNDHIRLLKYILK